jgi:hypothetical protein
MDNSTSSEVQLSQLRLWIRLSTVALNQALHQALNQAVRQALKQPLKNGINECVSTSEACRQLRLAEVNRLPAIYTASYIQSHSLTRNCVWTDYGWQWTARRAGVHKKLAMSCVCTRVCVAQSIVDIHFCPCNKVHTTSQPMRMLHGDCISITPTSIYV